MKSSESLGEKQQEWKRVIDLIPQVQKAVEEVMVSHRTHYEDRSQLQSELEELRIGIEIIQGKFTLDLIFILNGQGGFIFQ